MEMGISSPRSALQGESPEADLVWVVPPPPTLVMNIFVMCVLVTAEVTDAIVVWLPPAAGKTFLRKCCNSCSLAWFAGGRGGRAGGACTPSDRSLEEPGNPIFKLIFITCCVITDGTHLSALHSPFVKLKLWWFFKSFDTILPIYIGFGGKKAYSHVYAFIIKKSLPSSPNTSVFIPNKQSLVPQTCYVLFPISLKLTAELQKGKIK